MVPFINHLTRPIGYQRLFEKLSHEMDVDFLVLVLFFFIPEEKRVEILEQMRSSLINSSNVPSEIFCRYEFIRSVRDYHKDIDKIVHLLKLSDNDLQTHLAKDYLGDDNR